MALKGLKVLEFVGLAPGPFCGMILADFGATVTRIDKVNLNFKFRCTLILNYSILGFGQTVHNRLDVLQGGKRTIAVNLKTPEGVELVKRLSKTSDVLLEPFRVNVMEKLGLGPEILMKENPRLIYARLTGFGQNGVFAARAGHDINYIALSGFLSMLGRSNEKPTGPINFAADFAGGGLLCAFGICLAALERHHSGKGQIVDCAMVEGSAYIANWFLRSQKLPIWGRPRGENIIDTGAHFYDTYETKDEKFMSVGAIEPQFYNLLLEGLGLKEEDVPQFDDFEEAKEKFTEIFKTKTQEEWCKIFDDKDACVLPVLDWKQAARHPHNVARNVFTEQDGESTVNPAPKLSRTPGQFFYILKIFKFNKFS